MIKSITLKIGDKDYDLTYDELKELKTDLDIIFKTHKDVKRAYPDEIKPYPIKPPYDVWCSHKIKPDDLISQ